MFLFSLLLSLFPGWSQAGQMAFLVSASDLFQVQQAVEEANLPGQIAVRVFSPEERELPAAQEFIRTARVLVVNVMIEEWTDYVSGHVAPGTKRLYALRSSRDDAALKKQGYRFDPAVIAAFDNATAKNLRNLVRRIASLEFDPAITFDKPEKIPRLGIYHPDADSFFETWDDYARWYSEHGEAEKAEGRVGLMIYRASLAPGPVAALDAVVRRLEEDGLVPVAAFGPPAEVITKLLAGPDGRPRVDAVLAFTMKFQSALKAKVRAGLESLGVPVINALSLYYGTLPEWRASDRGLQPLEVAWAVATPEISGLIEPSILTGKAWSETGRSGRGIFLHKAARENLAYLVPRLKKWILLRKKPNREKRVAILIYNLKQGKQNIGASYLNVFESLKNILEAMQRAGYDAAIPPGLSRRSIRDLMLKSGRNIGSWAPGELKRLAKEGDVVRVPARIYRQWLERLPVAFREPVLRQWGLPEKARVMMERGDFIIPAVRFGKVVVLPEPARGFSDDLFQLYHSPTFYPHHQYVAVYAWLREGFHADAVIHLGTHATHEWLPGKQAGLSPSCPPDALLGELPNIYPYIMDDVGEGIQAKRRGRGVIIDHLTPPVRPSGLYGEYSKLEELIGAWRQSSAQGSETAATQLDEITQIIHKTGIGRDLGIEKIDPEGLHEVVSFLRDMRAEFMPYGLHSFGQPPQGKALEETLEAIRKQNGGAAAETAKAELAGSGDRELKQLLAALNGRYIPPGEGGDPVRQPEALPSGRNFYGFSPAKVPTRAAFAVGARAARDILQQSLDTNGHYPKKVAVILWATETQRNWGVNESTILSLMGMEPTWDKSGRVTGTAPIPMARLKRPRVDVLIQPSGLYRDLLPNVMKLLDDAVRQAAALEDGENYIQQNSRAIRQRLISQGMDRKEADFLASTRIFSEEPGNYGTRVAELVNASGVWESDKEIAWVFQERAGYAYGGEKWGVPAPDLFKENLRSVETAVHSVSSNLFGLVDNDDVFQYLGGMSLAVKEARGRAPDLLLTYSRGGKQSSVQPLGRALGREIRCRYLNPKWIRGMMKEGYAGASEMYHFAENLWGWQATVPSAVDKTRWQQAYEVYVEDKHHLGLKKFFKEENPWAFQAMTAWMLETVRKGYWKPPALVKEKLAAEYASSVAGQGAACCCHACNNPLLNQMVSRIVSRAKALPRDKLEQFKQELDRVTLRKLESFARSRRELQRRIRQGFSLGATTTARLRASKSTKNPKASTGTPGVGGGKVVEGYKMEPIGETRKPRPRRLPVSSAVVYLAIALIAALGYWLTRKSRHEGRG